MGNTYIFDDSHDYTGAVATFTDTHGTSRITNISVPFSPIQDLHGYDHPWPAGGGKNLLDDSIKSSSAGGYVYFNTAGDRYHKTTTLQAGTYTFSVTYSQAFETTKAHLRVYDVGTDTMLAGVYNGTKVSFTLTDTTDICLFLQNSGLTASDILKAQLELGSTATSWEPYSNICPISGRTGANVYRTGKNLIDDAHPSAQSASNIAWGCSAINGNADGTLVLPAGSYTVSASENMSGIYVNDKNGTSIKVVYNNTVASFTLSESKAVKVLFYKAGATDMTQYNYQLEVGSSATTYEPYKSNTYSVDWTTQAGTVYGGTLDVVTGVLTVNRALVDMTAFAGRWNIDRPIQRTYIFLNEAKTPSTQPANILCNRFETRSFEDIYVGKLQGVALSPSSALQFHINGLTDDAVVTTAMVDQYFVDNPTQVVYELATPLTYQLTAQEVSVIKNSLNNVWASTGSSITVTVKDIAYGFQGWLVKVGSSLTLVPTEMIEAESYKVTPDQRMEESAERDTTGYLWRDTVRNTPPKIEFNTPPVNNTQVAALNAIFQSAFTVKSQRKLQVAFFDPEEDCYKIWDCYMPDVEYPMHLIDPDAKTILYDSIRYAFIGY